jgi:CheY-like chemotaxis protein
VGIEQVSSLAEALETALEAKDLEMARTSLDNLTTELARISASPRTVLCIEDDPTSLLLVQRVAARTPGVRLLSAQEGREGLELARRERPDLVLLDIVLPDVPGDEVLRRLRADPVTADIPVVVLSANARPERAAEVLAAGATEYVTKPLDVKQLIALIQGEPE